jgi:ATP-dependent DNA helicase RecG
MTRAELQTVLRISNKKYFLTDFIKPALEVGSIEMTIPDKPNSKNQKYRLTIRYKQLKT